MSESLRRMQEFVQRHGKELRPHCKTHKCANIAKEQLSAGAVGVCVTKLSEAEIFAAEGIDRLLITSPIATAEKWERFARLRKFCADLLVVIDSHRQAELLAAALRKEGIEQSGVLLDLDAGSHRTGVPLSRTMDLGKKILQIPELELRGVQAYAGWVQHIPNHQERLEKSRQCMSEAAQVFNELRKIAPQIQIFTGGGTGSHESDVQIPEITDIQAGSYLLMDANYLALEGVNYPAALTLLTTVISTHHSDFVTVDAGLKAIYRDGPPPKVITAGYGHLSYEWNGDEHGTLRSDGRAPLPQEGEVIRLIVSHCDPTINLHDEFHVLEKGEIVDHWPVTARGMTQ